MTTENQTQPTENASQAQRDREILRRVEKALARFGHWSNSPVLDFDAQDINGLLALATRALELEASLPELLDEAKREASHAVLCGMVERLGLDGMQKNGQESLESVLFRYAEEHEGLRAENATLREADKAGGETIRRLEGELERMNAVVAGMEADAEWTKDDAMLGRVFREFIDHQHGYLEIDGGDPDIRNGSPVMVYGADDGKASQGMGGCLLDALKSLADDREAPSTFRAALKAALEEGKEA